MACSELSKLETTLLESSSRLIRPENLDQKADTHLGQTDGAEDDQLATLFGKPYLTIDQIAAKMGRTHASVRGRAQRLSLDRYNESGVLTQTVVARMLGCHRQTVLDWIASGKLKPTRIWRGGGHQRGVRAADLVCFL